MMTDIRLDGLAKVLVNYSIQVNPGDRVIIDTNPEAIPLVERLVYHILKAGGHPEFIFLPPEVSEVFLEHATDNQIDQPSNLRFLLQAYQTFECAIIIGAETNTKRCNRVAPERRARLLHALEPILKARFEREATGELRRVSTLYPTNGYAQDAGMGIRAYEDFVYRACQIDRKRQDPVKIWQALKIRQNDLIEALTERDEVVLRGENCDLQFSVRGRTFLSDHGRVNMPGGEIYTGPVEASVNGWISFNYPGYLFGRDVRGAELHFVNGRVEKATATENEEFLIKTLAMDKGASYVGEFGIGTNEGIQDFTGNILFDEKIAGTMHLAMGRGYPETGNTNESAIHWDMIFDARKDVELMIDGEVIYKDGKFRI
jgi:aminopeptidase